MRNSLVQSGRVQNPFSRDFVINIGFFIGTDVIIANFLSYAALSTSVAIAHRLGTVVRLPFLKDIRRIYD